MKMGEHESLNALFHEGNKRKYDPVKRHEYYERTKKLKGRKKGRQKTPSIRDLRRKALLNQAISSIPAKTVEQKKVSNDLLAKASQTSLAEAQERLRLQKEAASRKQAAEALEAKRFALENRKLDLESSKLDLDAQKTELDLREKQLKELKRKRAADPVSLAQEERQITLARNKLAIQLKKFDLESQKLDEDLKKLGPKPSSSLPPFLVHEYDPVKRHEYYERTKKLKGRVKGSGVQTSNKSSGSDVSGGNKNSKAKTSEQQKAEIKARVTAYKARLEKLKEVLALLVAEAKKRSADNAGTKESRAERDKKDTPSTKGSGTSGKSGSSTAKEKAAAKDYYEKNKEKISLKKQEANLKDQIKEVEEKIVKIRAELKDSIKKARNKQRNSK